MNVELPDVLRFTKYKKVNVAKCRKVLPVDQMHISCWDDKQDFRFILFADYIGQTFVSLCSLCIPFPS